MERERRLGSVRLLGRLLHIFSFFGLWHWATAVFVRARIGFAVIDQLLVAVVRYRLLALCVISRPAFDHCCNAFWP